MLLNQRTGTHASLVKWGEDRRRQKSLGTFPQVLLALGHQVLNIWQPVMVLSQ